MNKKENSIKKEKNPDTCEKQAQEYLDNWKRAQADLINYRKDESKRAEALVKFCNEALVLEMLDVLDNLRMAVKHASDEIKAQKDWFVGLEQVEKNAKKLLERHGVKEIETRGKTFDPLVHEVIHKEKDGQDIVEEIRPGYTLHGKVIRPARVKLGHKNNQNKIT
jgi:molecular chaperone GrpE